MKIIITRCDEPKNCMKCVEVCPAKIFALKPRGTKRLSNHVEKWKIVPIFKNLCNGCMKCVEVCSNGYIRIEF